MNTNYGDLFRMIRISQNLTLKEASQGIISLSYLGKFETGKTNITLDIFLQLLDRINVPVNEFISLCNETTYKFDQLATKIEEAYRKSDLTLLIQLKKNEEQRFMLTQKKTHKINSIMISAAIFDLNPNAPISMDDSKIIADYLLQVSFWSSYNLFIFSCSHAIISPYLLVKLINEIKKMHQNTRINFSSSRPFIFLFHHAAITFLRNDLIEQAVLVSDYVKKLLTPSCFFEKNRSLFIQGLIMILQGNTYDGLTLANDAINIVKMLEEPLANRYILELERTLEKAYS